METNRLNAGHDLLASYLRSNIIKVSSGEYIAHRKHGGWVVLGYADEWELVANYLNDYPTPDLW
jgi:hypothetical protein